MADPEQGQKVARLSMCFATTGTDLLQPAQTEEPEYRDYVNQLQTSQQKSVSCNDVESWRRLTFSGDSQRWRTSRYPDSTGADPNLDSCGCADTGRSTCISAKDGQWRAIQQWRMGCARSPTEPLVLQSGSLA